MFFPIIEELLYEKKGTLKIMFQKNYSKLFENVLD